MVIRKFAYHLELIRISANKSETTIEKTEGMRFIKARRAALKANEIKYREHSVGLLNRALDWELRVDLDKRLVFPCGIKID